MKPDEAFAILGLEPGCSAAELKERYRDLVLEFHPDRFPASDPRRTVAEQMTKRLTLAYGVARSARAPLARPELPQPAEPTSPLRPAALPGETAPPDPMRIRASARRRRRMVRDRRWSAIIRHILQFCLVAAMCGACAWLAIDRIAHRQLRSAAAQAAAWPAGQMRLVDATDLMWGEPSPTMITGTVHNRSSQPVQGVVVLRMLVWRSRGFTGTTLRAIPMEVFWAARTDERVAADAGIARTDARFGGHSTCCDLWFERAGMSIYHIYKITRADGQVWLARFDHTPSRQEASDYLRAAGSWGRVVSVEPITVREGSSSSPVSGSTNTPQSVVGSSVRDRTDTITEPVNR